MASIMAGKYNLKNDIIFHVTSMMKFESQLHFFSFIFTDDDMESFVVLGSSPPSDSDSFNSFSMASNRAGQNPQNSLKFSQQNSLKSDGNSLMRSALYEPVTEPISLSSLNNENGNSSLIKGAKSLVPVATGTQNNLNSMTLSKIEFKSDETSMVSSFAADIILGKMGPKSVQVKLFGIPILFCI